MNGITKVKLRPDSNVLDVIGAKGKPGPKPIVLFKHITMAELRKGRGFSYSTYRIGYMYKQRRYLERRKKREQDGNIKG